MKRNRFVITRRDPVSPRPYSMYLTSLNGLCSYHQERAKVFKTEAQAQAAIDEIRSKVDYFVWRVEPFYTPRRK